MALSLEYSSPGFPFKLSILFSILRASWKVSSKVYFSAFLTNMAIDMGRTKVYKSIVTSSTCLETHGIFLNRDRNCWLKYLIFSLAFNFILERSKTKVVSVLSSPNFLRKIVSNILQLVIGASSKE
jgi:hypothetical protein